MHVHKVNWDFGAYKPEVSTRTMEENSQARLDKYINRFWFLMGSLPKRELYNYLHRLLIDYFMNSSRILEDKINLNSSICNLFCCKEWETSIILPMDVHLLALSLLILNVTLLLNPCTIFVSAFPIQCGSLFTPQSLVT